MGQQQRNSCLIAMREEGLAASRCDGSAGRRSRLLTLCGAALVAIVAAIGGPASQAQSQSLPGGSQGMVAANHPLATFAGMDVLLDGGNAVDAAVATAATLGVVEPALSGLGGDGVMLIYWAEADEVHALSFAGKAPDAISGGRFAEEGLLPARGPRSVVVPGAPAGWDAALERFGSLPIERILAPAIDLAENGYPASAFAAEAQGWAAQQFLDYDEVGAEAWWGGDFMPPQVGDMIRNPRLGNTYRELAEQGLNSFYSGEIATTIIGFLEGHGGFLTTEDFEAYDVSWHEPLTTTYRDFEIFTARRHSSGGLATLQILSILEGFDLGGLQLNGVEYTHLVVEAVKLAAADRAVWSGDPAFLADAIPYERLLSKEYAAERRALIDLDRAAPDVQAGIEQPGTSHVSVVDRAGNMVSLTVSLGLGWGSGVVAGETGVVMNNGLAMFDLDPESPTHIDGGKRVTWNMAPVLVAQDGQPFIVLGTPGGTGIWQVTPQILTKVLDFGLDLRSAIESPRFRWELSGLGLGLESRIGADTREGLEELGHDVYEYEAWSISVGAANGIVIDFDEGVMEGAADPRREGYVIGW